MWICCIAIANKQDGVHFSLVLNRICILLFFCPRRAQGFKPSAAHIYPRTGRVTRGEWTRKDKFNETCFYSPGDIHFWIYDDVTDNCILDLQRKISILNAFVPLLFWFLSFMVWDHVIFLTEHQRNMWSKRKKECLSAAQRKICVKWIQLLRSWCILSGVIFEFLQISGR